MQNSVSTLSTRLRESITDEIEYPVDFQRATSKQLYSGLRKSWVHFRLKVSLLRIAVACYANPIDWVRALRFLVHLRRRFLGNFRLKKMVQVDGKYYMGLYTPGWNDVNYKRFIASELHHFKPNKIKTLRFNHVYLAVTKKCALQCDHCYTWDLLNGKEFFDETKLLKVLKALQRMGTGQIHLTGGEPILKMDLLLTLLQASDGSTNFWINTSGFKLHAENAKKLKKAGLTGVFISLDHHDEQEHNDFRKFKDAYYWALEAARNALANDLVVAFSICLRNDFVMEGHLVPYLELAKRTGVHFVQFLDPKSVGHYRDTAEPLRPEIIEYVEDLYEKANFTDAYPGYPILSYPSYYQRRQGCFAAGNRGVYVDPEGDLHACPFCHSSVGNVMENDIDTMSKSLQNRGCPTY